MSSFPSPSSVLSISELNRRTRQLLENNFPLLWVGGEISNLMRAASGHVYFSLKDESAQVRCVMFRSRAQTLPWRLENGQQVEAQVLVSLYEARGDFQLNVESMRRAGLGQLFEAFARLKSMLESEGLFAPERKRALPSYPRCIGIVTSPQAAALRDILSTLARRAPHVPIVLYPSLVQGENASAGIAAAIAAANRQAACDVLIVARGGGSIEDLWAFNEEISARAIAASKIPVISGVGHETDFTIADFAADLRAATPTAAAELVSTGWHEAGQRIAHLHGRLQTHMQRELGTRMQRVDLLAHRLVSPRQRLANMQQQVTVLSGRLQHAMQRNLNSCNSVLANYRFDLRQARPQLVSRQAHLQQLRQGLANAMQQRIQTGLNNYTLLQSALAHLNPEATLARGYSIVRDSDGKIIRNSGQLRRGDTVRLRFGQGGASAHVDSID